MRFTVLAVVAAFASFVAAQNGLPTCAQSCVTNYISGSNIGSCSNIDVHCICSSSDFLSGIACCLAGKCDDADQQAATLYAKNICATAGVTTPDSVQDLCPNNSSSTTAASSSTTPTAASTAANAGSTTASATGGSTSASSTPNVGLNNAVAGGAALVGGAAALLALL